MLTSILVAFLLSFANARVTTTTTDIKVLKDIYDKAAKNESELASTALKAETQANADAIAEAKSLSDQAAAHKKLIDEKNQESQARRNEDAAKKKCG